VGAQTALGDLKVIDLTTNAAGPIAARLFGELGANVIKVEPPWGDDGRNSTTRYLGQEGMLHLANNRNKRGIAVNLKTPVGLEVFHRLLSNADVFIENTAPGTLDRYGLDFAHVHALNPRLVYVSISGWGQQGPLAQDIGYGLVASAFAAATIFQQTETPLLRGGMGDPAAGLLAAWAASVALRNRDRTGVGSHVTTSVVQGAVHLGGMSFALSEFERQSGAERPVESTAVGGIGPYKTADGQWVYLNTWTDEQFRRLYTLAGFPHVAEDPAYATRLQRAEHGPELNELLGYWISTMPRDAVIELLRSASLPVAPMRQRFEELIDDEQVRANDMLIAVEHPTKGPIWQVGCLYEIDGERGTPQPAPLLGQHTDEVLAEHGYSPAEIADLHATSAVT
jgi:crotonobetainyl-CoA:carnitine CoA-transferase CaiB-like acyl-CoA transferase